jgi:hypothetical protein
MATVPSPNVTTADDRAWDLFFEALDADSAAAARIPPGAAIVAADAPDRDELVRRYHADHRSVVLVHADGRTETLRPRPRPLDLEQLLIIGGAVVLAWLVLRSGAKAPSYGRVLRAVGV